MAHLIIWGDPRSVLAGDAHAGAEEVRSFAALEAALDGHGAALVLAAPDRLAAERDAVEAWIHKSRAQAVLIAIAEAGDGDDLLQRFPFVDDVISRPLSRAQLRLKLERATEAVHSRRVILQLEKALDRKDNDLELLNDIGKQLSAQHEIEQLLDLILRKSREITDADAGSLYLVERAPANGESGVDQLRFELAQNDSVTFAFKKQQMPLDDSSIAGYAALSKNVVNVADAYRLPENSSYRISRSFDERSGYRSKSMLVVPMRDHENKVIGVVQLINKKRERSAVLRPTALVDEQVIPFTSVDEQLAGSLASQAAVALENTLLLKQIRALFDKFVDAAVTAIEQRDPTTSGHSQRVAILTVGLMEKVDQIQTGPLAGERYTPGQVEEVRYAAKLHDFGKVAVQEKYLRKGKKLYASQLIALRQRFAYILKSIEADYLRAKLQAIESGASKQALDAIEADYLHRRTEAERVKEIVEAANEPTVVEEERFRALMSLTGRRFASFEELQQFNVEDWADSPYLSSDEIELLSIRKGSLSDNELAEIQKHVTETYLFLNALPWTGDLKRVPEIAYAHHEKLNGSGYPRKLKGAEIPRQAQMMTISDIYDALVATDRPYKKAVTPERAREILSDEARLGRVDVELLRIFTEAEIYQLPEFKRLLQKGLEAR